MRVHLDSTKILDFRGLSVPWRAGTIGVVSFPPATVFLLLKNST
jgi:hypothetical protein